MANLEPIIDLPNLYVNGLQISYVSAAVLSLGIGQCRDSSDTYDIVLNAPLPIGTAFYGPGGLDTGTVAANTWYAVYLLFDPTNTNPPATLLSAAYSSTLQMYINPVMPSIKGITYSAYRLLGYVLTDGSSNLLPMNIIGSSNSRRNYWYNTIRVLSAGTATTFTAVPCGAAIPSLDNIEATIVANYTSPSAGDPLGLRTYLTTATNPTYVNTQVASVASIHQVRVLTKLANGLPGFEYKNGVASGSTSLDVSDFKYFI